MKSLRSLCPPFLPIAGSAGLWVVVGWLLAGSAGKAAIIHEDFATDPLNHRWRVFGDSSLFTFDQAKQKLNVTWDSSRSNSYYYLPVDNILNREDDFGMELDLELIDIRGGVNTNKPSTFELAFGFINMLDGFKTNFYRGNSSLSPNLVEFDFFPDTGFGPTMWPSIWSTNSSLNYNGSGDYSIISLPTGVVMRVSMSYSASNQTLKTSVSTNGISVGVINNVMLSPSFSDFRIDAFALESYSDGGQAPLYGGSLLARGLVDNIVLSIPPAPVREFALMLTNQQWLVSFKSRTNWVYAVERSTDFQTWATASPSLTGNDGKVFWQDSSEPSTKAFYRVRAARL